MLKLNMSTIEDLEKGPLLQVANEQKEKKESIAINMDKIMNEGSEPLMINDPESMLIWLLVIIVHFIWL
jgi:hypothetical protein